LFPQSYTTAASPEANGDDAETPPTATTSAPGTGTILQPLAEESETDSPMTKPAEIVSPVPRQPAATFLNGNDESDRESLSGEPLNSSTDGEMMKATLTDVQKAIEQLGRNRADHDGGRSFSFASTRDGGDTDTDFDISDIEGGDNGEIEGEDWHKGARRKLAEKARQAVEDAQKLEAMMEQRSTAPPIDVELSDESEDEGDIDYTSRSNFQRTHPHIPEEDEDEAPPAQAVEHKQEASSTTASTLTPHAAAARSTSSIPSQIETTPQPKVEEVPEVRTATQPTFSPPPLVVEPSLPVERAPSGPTPAASAVENSSLLGDSVNRHSAPTPLSQLSNLPSPTESTHASGFHINAPFQPISASSTGTSTNPTSVSNTQLASPHSDKDKKAANEWSVEEVVDWLKSKGFDQDVCSKFIGV
jgi:hypothetical protein